MKRRNIKTRRRPIARKKGFPVRGTIRQVVKTPKLTKVSPSADPEVSEAVKRRGYPEVSEAVKRREVSPDACPFCGEDRDGPNHDLAGVSGDSNSCRATYECFKRCGSQFSRNLEGREAAAAHRKYYGPTSISGNLLTWR